MDYKSLDIHQLWSLIINDDEQALIELLSRFEPVIRAESTIDGHIDEDISQEIRAKFVEAIRSLHQTISH